MVVGAVESEFMRKLSGLGGVTFMWTGLRWAGTAPDAPFFTCTAANSSDIQNMASNLHQFDPKHKETVS